MIVEHRGIPGVVLNSPFAITSTLTLQIPVRIDFLGGWTDQECWEGPGAVLNAAVGWDGKYPLSLSSDGEWSSVVDGQGTGLGISSIRHAGRRLWRRVVQNGQHPFISDSGTVWDAITYAVQTERDSGVQGGWQDAAGALIPGLKVVGGKWEKSGSFCRNEPPLSVVSIPKGFSGGKIFDTVVLFDTGIRRDSSLIGEKVRALIRADDPKLLRILRHAIRRAPLCLFDHGTRDAIDDCLEAWRSLCECVPEMRGPEMPRLANTEGYKLCGAGGGGYGIYFCLDPEDRESVRNELLKRGYWATIPELLPGPRWVSSDG